MALAKITTIGRINFCKAHAGDIVLPKITHMAFGIGGLDGSGDPLPVTGNETKLQNEVLRKAIEYHEFPTDTVCNYVARIEKTELIKIRITEQGLYDEGGNLVVYKTFPAREKDSDEEFLFMMKEIF